AAINIEAVFDEINGEELNYEPFEGIVLTDTFQSTETEDTLDDDFFGGNDERLKRQQEVPITVIMGNPPYSAKQNDANDDNANIKYPKLDEKIRREYVEHSNANLQNNLYDSYIRAFRWASDRLTGKGVIGFVSNGQFIDSLAADGLRYSLYNEFNHLYIFNLRGDQRTVGEQSRKEGGKIFGSGSRTPIAISILVKDGSDNHEVHYHDIGDYLNREQKLSILRESGTIENIEWSELVPDKNHDWINQRDENYDNFYSLDGEVFTDTAIGVKTNRDTWVFNFGKETVQLNSSRMIDNYLIELEKSKNSSYSPNLNPAVIKWSAALTAKLNKKEVIEFNKSNLIISQYRPFTKKWLYNGKDIIERPGRMQTLFSDKSVHNVLYSTGKGTKKDFSVLITNNLPEYMMMDNGQAFPLEILKINENTLFEDSTLNIKGFFEMSEEDSFCYVYGVLHSPEYKEKYSSDLKKALPRIPLLKNKEKFVEIGRKLADLHLNYEHQPSWEGVTVSGEDSGNFKVKKMKHPKKGQLDTIVFNESITVSNIPDQAYEYVVNGRSAIEWIIDQYQIKTDKKSGITDDPNEFAPENPRYILDLLLSVITVSMRTVELVAQLPEMEVVK
ncbi:MAG: type ISP restriction/modification enzyme, partial [Lactococcus lactis]|nr:type ISP restriction/modification enzyme [Lactococcus lactis]